MKKIINFILAFFLFHSYSLCQSVVISEYFNSNVIRNEWTELLVIEDNLRLVGYTLRDNAGSSGTPDSWQGGIRFRNHPLWNNVRVGTIIVINHRRNAGFNTDIDKSDGYIEVDAENTELFEKRCFDCDTATDWVFKALSIAQTSDIIQLLDAQDNHIHALAHIPIAPKGDYLSLPNPKVCRNGSIQNNSSLRIVPGNNLAAYNSGYGNLENDESTSFITKGKPNNSSNYQNYNQLFWRSLRNPEWVSPSLSVEIFPNQNYLEWSKMTDSYPDDNLSGYLIVRVIADSIAYLNNPIDGKVYFVGDKLGSGDVISVISNSNILNLYDKFIQKCGTEYFYYVFAFRYNKDDLGEDNEPTFARGRSYNEISYAQAKALKSYPDKPQFSQKTLEICKGDSFILVANINYNFKEIIWFRNDEVIKNEVGKEVVIKEEGFYFCKVINEFGCEAISDTFHLILKPSPNNNLFVDGSLITRDTTIFKCSNDEITLSVSDDEEIEWFHNGNLIEKGKSTLSVKEEGEYFAKIANKEACSLNTFKVKVISQRDSIDIASYFLYFNLYRNETYLDKSIMIKNLSEQAVEIVKLTSPSGFQLLNVLPLRIEAKKSITVSIRFQSDKYIDIKGYITFYSTCGFKDSVYVTGTKKDSGLYASMDTLDFGELSCKTTGRYTVFQIHNPTDDSAVLYQPKFEKPFATTDQFYPYTLKGKKRVDIEVNFVPENFGEYSYPLLIPYKFLNVMDTLRVLLKGSKTLPDVELKPEIIEFPAMYDCDSTRDTIITITNKSKYTIYPKQFDSLQNISITDLPPSLAPGESHQVKISLNFNSEVDSIYTLIFNIDPCNLEKQINLKIKKLNQSIHFDKDTVDFGTVAYCGENIFEKRTIKLTIDKFDSTKNYIIKHIESKGSFKSNLYNGLELTESNNIDLYFIPDVDGDFSGYLKIIIESCNIVKYLYLKGRRVSPEIVLSSREIDFGKIQVNSISNKSIILENKCEIDFKLEEIIGPLEPFKLISTISFPYILKAKSQTELEFSYNPVVPAFDTSYVEIVFSEPCQITEKVLITGESFVGDSLKFKLSIPKLSAKIGEKINIPINIKVPEDLKLQLFNMENLNFNFCYNPTLFIPYEITLGNTIDNSKVKSLSMSENILGKANIDISFDNISDLNDGVFVNIVGRTLLGNSTKTKLKITDIKFQSNRLINVETEDGELEILGDCHPDDRIIDLSRQTKFIIKNISNEQITFWINVISDDPTKLVIYNNLGNEILSLTNEAQKLNKNEIKIRLDGFTNGIYHAVLLNGNIIRKITFPVVR
ncbi:MAG: hypothetical protein N2319_06840 [Candidatus Kapabacteria bacterium]|nr:hypothetical protein [Candidatus Kapabacteria bacterium]